MLRSGARLSHYKIISAIGAGGMGEVYLAEDTKLEREVALKVLLDAVSSDEDRVRRFIQEAKAASALNHPNILTVFEIDTFEGSRYIATELIKGETLRDRMKGEPLKLGQTLDIALQVAAALCAAHEAGIIHRDIKPENIMIRNDGLVKVLDFGLAKLSGALGVPAGPHSSEDATRAQLNTEPGLIMGTVAYMSPEQAKGKKLDPRTDIFSLGIVMYELFSGKRPFDGEGHLDLVSSILKDDPPPLRQIAPGLPRQLERIVDKALRKDRDHRYQHVKDLHIDLEDLRDEIRFEAKFSQIVEPTISGAAQTTNAETRSTFTTSVATTRRFTLLHALLFAIIAGVVVGGLWFYYSRTNPSSAIAGSLKTTEVATWNSAPGEIFSDASFSPDGKMIAFASTKSGTKNIWVTQTASTEAIQVTNDAFLNTDPIWSPKGDEIAFFSQRGPDDKPSSIGIWRVPALGGTARSVGAISNLSSHLRRWTASGKIYYEMNNDLHAADTASGISQQVTLFSAKGVRPVWIDISPDEKSIIYVTEGEGAWQLFVSDLAGSSPVKIADGSGNVEGVAWLPDKNRIFYSALIDGVFQVFAADTSGGKGSRVTSSETDSVVVDAAPDGNSIIFSSAKEESNLWRVNVTDGQESPLARDLNSKLWPAISPDNTRMAFQSVKNLSAGNHLLESAIVVKPVKARDEGERPTMLAERGFLPAWSPDGSTLAFMRQNANGAVDLFAVNPNGGGERLLTTGGIPVIGYSVSPYNQVHTRAFAWSPDSSRIAYVSERGGSVNIWSKSPRDGKDEPLTDNTDKESRYFCPIWSAEGKKLAFYAERRDPANASKTLRAFKVIDLDSRKTTDIYETSKRTRLIGWAADESGLIFAESENATGLPPETLLKRVATAGGTEGTLATLKNAYFYNIFLSDDRKQIAYAARNDSKDDIWLIASTGGEARKLTGNNDTGLYFSRLAWLHDGSAIVFGKQTRFSLLSLINDIK
jgi:eukaryotic-like serine/threonine-protein kinase